MKIMVMAFPMMLIGCAKHVPTNVYTPIEDPKSTQTIILTPNVEKEEENIRYPRSHWYPSYFVNPCAEGSGCQILGAFVLNNTDKPQTIRLGVYGRREDGTKFLYSSESALVQPNVDNSNQWIPIHGWFPHCPYEVYLTQMDVNFNPTNPNVNTDGYLINAMTGNNSLSCK